MHTNTCTCQYVLVYMHIYTHIYVHTHTCAHTFMHVCTCVYTCTFVYTHDVLFLGSRETVKFAQLRSCDLRPGGGWWEGKEGKEVRGACLRAGVSHVWSPSVCSPLPGCDCSVPNVGSTCSQHRGVKGVRSYLSHSISPMSWF